MFGWKKQKAEEIKCKAIHIKKDEGLDILANKLKLFITEREERDYESERN
jgi:hypothetical protein